MKQSRHRLRNGIALLTATGVVAFGVIVHADAAVVGCGIAADRATSFAPTSGAAGSVSMRIGCAGDAGDLAKQADATSSSDLLVAYDFNDGNQQAFVAQRADEINAAKGRGESLSDFFKDQAHAFNLNLAPHPADGVAFNGSARAINNTLVLDVPAGDIGANSNWWQKAIGVLAGYAVQAGVEAACGVLIATTFPPLLPATFTICHNTGGFLGGLVGDLVNSAFDGRSFGEPAVWAEAFAVGAATVISPVLYQQFNAFLKTSATALVAGLRATIRFAAERLGWGRGQLTAIGDGFEGFELPLWNAVDRRANVAGGMSGPGGPGGGGMGPQGH
jgi:hypothetical protein